jgi:putative NIF3 family GTP cyclohydrolase 1 type 2
LALASATAKRAFVERHALSIVRCHDLWDAYPDLGVPDAWGRALGLGRAALADGFLRVYEIEPTTAEAFARRVARAVAPLGQQAVQLIGPAEAEVRRVSVGTGAITPVRRALIDLGVDLAVCTDDGIAYWRDGALAIDAGVPLVVVNHPVSEEAAMIHLADLLRERLAPLPVYHLPQRCMFRLVGP